MAGDKSFCTMCNKEVAATRFWKINSIVNSSGLLHICGEHINELFDTLYRRFHTLPKNFELSSETIVFDSATENAMREVCRYIDLVFEYDSYESLKSHIEKAKESNRKIDKIFGVYKTKLALCNKGEVVSNYEDSDDVQYEKYQNEINVEITDKDLEVFWGRGFDNRDYDFLEIELGEWKKTHKCDNQAELTLLKEICIKILEIRTAREQSNSNVGKLQKDLQDLLKTASLDPAKANAASAGKSHECWGLYIKEIEQKRPAEWFEDQKKYKDMDGFDLYIKNYIVRPIMNFLSGTRNFIVDDNIDANLDDIDISNVEGDSDGE